MIIVVVVAAVILVSSFKQFICCAFVFIHLIMIMEKIMMSKKR